MKKPQQSSDPATVSSQREETRVPIRAPRGAELSCKDWPQETALRLLLNSLDPEVSGAGTQRGSIESEMAALQSVASNQSLLLQEGNPPLIFQSGEVLPRVLILDSIARSAAIREPGHSHLLLRRRSTADWTSAGLQSSVCDAFFAFAGAAKAHFGSDLFGRFVVSGGMGVEGGAVSLAARMNGAAFLGIEANEQAILARIRDGFCDICVNDLDEALRILKVAIRRQQPTSVGLVGNCSEILPEMARRGVVPDLLSDGTGPAERYIPAGLSPEQAKQLRLTDGEEYLERVRDSITQHATAVSGLQRLGSKLIEFGDDIISLVRRQGLVGASDSSGLASKYLLRVLALDAAPTRWFALSGERSDIFRLDEALLKVSQENPALSRWVGAAAKHLRSQGLPARVAWLTPAEREQFGASANAMVASGVLNAPVVLCRDHLWGDPASVQVSEGPAMEWDAVRARRLLKGTAKAVRGSVLTSFEIIGDHARLASQALLADGSPEAAQRIQRIFGSGGNA